MDISGRQSVSRPSDGGYVQGDQDIPVFDEPRCGWQVLTNCVDGHWEVPCGPREKKSSFQITRVVSRSAGLDDSDSIDDRNGLEDFRSDVTDVSVSTNILTNIDSEDTMYSSMEDVVIGIPPLQDEFKERDVHSRFRLVKIDPQAGVQHGRWRCLDYNDNILQSRLMEEPVFYEDINPSSRLPANLSEELLPQAKILFAENLAAVCDLPTPGQCHPMENSPFNGMVFSHSSHGSYASPHDLSSRHSSAFFPVDPLSMPPDPLVGAPSLSSTMMDDVLEKECLNAAMLSSNPSLLGNCNFVSRFQSFQFVTENLLSNRIRKRSDASDLELLDESGASAVAIDNKIEQAMDLVKSHLMFAVREEVEQLKLKIQELTERNSQLEYENTILRASAPQETLARLQKSPSMGPS